MKESLAVIGAVIAAGLIWRGAAWAQLAGSPPLGTTTQTMAVPAASATAESSPAAAVPWVPRPVPAAEPGSAIYFESTKRHRSRPLPETLAADVRAKLHEAHQLADELTANSSATFVTGKKTELTEKLEAALGSVFDGDLADREMRLAQLEQRFKELRSLLERRRQARHEIVQLQMKVLLNEAAGLGFFTPDAFDPAASGPASPKFALPPTDNFSDFFVPRPDFPVEKRSPQGLPGAN